MMQLVADKARFAKYTYKAQTVPPAIKDKATKEGWTFKKPGASVAKVVKEEPMIKREIEDPQEPYTDDGIIDVSGYNWMDKLWDERNNK